MTNKKMINNRWVSTTASIWIQSTTGMSYAFTIYSPSLKILTNYICFQRHWCQRWCFIRVTLRFLFWGPMGCPCFWCGPVFFGLFFYLGRCCLPCFTPACFCYLFFFNTANVVTGVENFQDYRGTIVGIMKGYLGISGAILIQVYQAFFHDSPTKFILMLALLPTFVCLVLMLLVRIYPGSRVHDKKYLNGFSLIAVLLAAYLMLIIIVENVFVFPQWAHFVTLAGLFILLLSPLKISVEAVGKENTYALPTERDPLVFGIDPNEPQTYTGEKHGDYDELPSSSNDVPPATENMNLLDAMKSINFWLLFVAMACGMGSGLATINNLSQIGQALGYDTVKINTLVSLYSIWNFLGRFGGGYISDILLPQKKWARPMLMAITLAIMSAGHITIASGFPGNLYIGTTLVGICYGSQWSLMPIITSEIFGILHMGTIFNTIAIASPMGTYILSVLVIGHIYDHEAGPSHSCFGIHCFVVSFFVLAFVSLLGSLVALTLFFRTRTFYKSVVLKRLNHSLKA